MSIEYARKLELEGDELVRDGNVPMDAINKFYYAAAEYRKAKDPDSAERCEKKKSGEYYKIPEDDVKVEPVQKKIITRRPTVNNDLIVTDVKESDVPSIIKDQFTSLSELQEKINSAQSKADNAVESADNAAEKAVHWYGGKTDAIKALQEAARTNADATSELVDAQRVSFEYQQKLGEITKYLFALGVTNIAMNRSVVRQLELKLRDASAEELDEMARQEIIGVVKQLKAQEDIMKKQENLTSIVRSHDEKIGAGEKRAEDQDKELRRQAVKNEEHDKKIADGEKRDKDQDKKIAAGEEHDKGQDEEIARQAEKDVEHDARLDAGDMKDAAQDDELARQAEKDVEHDERLDAGDLKDAAQDDELARQAEKDVEHDARLDAGDMKDAAQDDELARQAEKDQEHDLRFAEVEKKVETQINLVQKLQHELTLLEGQVAELQKEEKAEEKMNGCFSRTASIVSAAIGAAGFILAIISLLH